jgi:adenylyltransferase/sulfurtransferase
MATRALTMLVPPPPPPPPATTSSGDAHGDGEMMRGERPPPAFDPDAEPARDMLLFSAGASPPFRSVRLRARRPGCLACGEPPSGAEERARSGGAERERAYGPPDSCAPLPPLSPLLAGGGGPSVSGGQGEGPPRVSARELAGSEARGRVLLDVRPRAQFELCALRGSVNAPWDEQAGGWDRGRWVAEARAAVAKSEGGEQRRVYVLCRNGIDSQAAARALREGGGEGWVGDVVGGLRAWRQEVDARFPDY